MRITGGIGRGRKLKAPAGARVRPTSDKVKQALFNILGGRIVGSRFLDLFAGAGSIGLEALSRGADQVVFVDGSRESISVIRQNIEALDLAGSVRVVASTAEHFLKRPSGSYDIIYLDPPYKMELEPLLAQIAHSGILKTGGIVVAEHFRKQPSPERAGELRHYREAVYGDTALAFYSRYGGSDGSEVKGQEEQP